MSETEAISLEQLRHEARLELEVVIEERCRAGEDPWAFMGDLPTVDELVVAMLRNEVLRQSGDATVHYLAVLASNSSAPDAEALRHTADDLEVKALREVALRQPELTRAVWSMVGRIGA
jgi:hypothetical protein